MSRMQRLRAVFAGLCMIAFAVILILYFDEGYAAVAFIFGIIMLLRGLRSMIYYFGMARHMAGGKMILFRGILMMDLGAFTLTLTDIPKLYLVLYLLGTHAVAGFLGFLRGLGARRMGSPAWRSDIIFGIGNILVAGAAAYYGIRTGRSDIPMYLYAAGLLYSAAGRISTAFRRTEIVYIQ